MRTALVLALTIVTASNARADGDADALTSPDVAERVRAAHALGERRDAAAVAPLVKALDDPYAPVASEAAWALGQVGSPEALAALEAVAAGKGPRRPLACAGLAAAGTPAALAALERAVVNGGPGTSEVNELVRTVLGRARADALLERTRRGERDLPASIPPDVRAALEALRANGPDAVRRASALLPGAATHFLAAAHADPRRAGLYLAWNTERRGHFPADVLLAARGPGEPEEVRRVALNELGWVPDEDVPVVAAALEGGLDPETCARAVSRVVEAFDGQIVALRRFALGDGPEGARASVCQAFVGHGRAKEVRAAGLRLLRSTTAEVRATGAYVLMATRDVNDEELAALVVVLEHETDERTREQARSAVAGRIGVDPERPDLVDLARRAVGSGRTAETIGFLDGLERARPAARPPLTLEPVPVLVAPGGWEACMAQSGRLLVARVTPQGAAKLFVVEGDALRPLDVSLGPIASSSFEPEGPGLLEWSDVAADGSSSLRRLDLATRAVSVAGTYAGASAPDDAEGGCVAFARPGASFVALRRRGPTVQLVETTRGEEVVRFEVTLASQRRAPPLGLSPTRARDAAALLVGGQVLLADLRPEGRCERIVFLPGYRSALVSPDGGAVLALHPEAPGALLVASDGSWARVIAADLAWRGGASGAPSATWLRDGKAVVLAARGELVVADLAGRVERLPLVASDLGERSEAQVAAVDARRVAVSQGRGPWPAAAAGTWLVDLSAVLARLAAGPAPAPPWEGRPADRSTPEGAFWSWFRACLDGRITDVLALEAEDGREDVTRELASLGLDDDRQRGRFLRESATLLDPERVEVELDGDRATVRVISRAAQRSRETSLELVREGERWSLAPRGDR